MNNEDWWDYSFLPAVGMMILVSAAKSDPVTAPSRVTENPDGTADPDRIVSSFSSVQPVVKQFLLYLVYFIVFYVKILLGYNLHRIWCQQK